MSPDPALVIFSGGLYDAMNPQDVLDRMDEICSVVLPGLRHTHQLNWRGVSNILMQGYFEPLVIIGHSQGGAAANNLAWSLPNHDVSLLWTCDTVPTGDDPWDIRVVPPNVKLSFNSYTIPSPAFDVFKFPIGKPVTRSCNTTSLLNLGMWQLVPGIVAHHNAFYNLAGGPLNKFTPLIQRTMHATMDGELISTVLESAVHTIDDLAIMAGFRAETSVWISTGQK